MQPAPARGKPQQERVLCMGTKRILDETELSKDGLSMQRSDPAELFDVQVRLRLQTMHPSKYTSQIRSTPLVKLDLTTLLKARMRTSAHVEIPPKLHNEHPAFCLPPKTLAQHRRVLPAAMAPYQRSGMKCRCRKRAMPRQGASRNAVSSLIPSDSRQEARGFAALWTRVPRCKPRTRHEMYWDTV